MSKPLKLVFLNLMRFGLFVGLSSCLLSPDEYDASVDNGTYTGNMVVYDGPGTDANFIDRTCPEIAATLVIQDESVVLSTTDTYPNYVHVGGVVTSHTASGRVFANNKFTVETGWTIEETDTQLSDLMNLQICEATPPTDPLDVNTGGRGLLQDFALRVDEPGFVGEFGEGIARGSLFYGVRCTDGSFIPICLYFMDLRK